ncbi:hypothetical protein LOTGIDRAFT_210552 [Lottia gigantea]|uniref:Adenosine kinase n=1 Tax=Lottia gigantea TaxID=225164 RepID=V3ZS32_LOTGI|nr:hypothetical protein LOTGIDRAFT_210552 [Lottia gigantea]ESO87167.1 hypothetical protein LOTGIDRAFT_210552 [Lottia gigantea]
MARPGILLGYGNPLLDISIISDEDFLKKYDLKANNAILAEEKHLPMYDDMVKSYPDTVEYVPGGATLNAIRVAQWLVGVDNATTVFGCIGKDDKFGSILKEKGKDAGVNVKFQVTEKQPTGTCAVVCTEKNRSLVANLAAANCFTESHLDDPENWKLVEKADFYYCAGFPLTVCPEAMLRIAKHANEHNKVFCMNLSAPFLCTVFKSAMLQVLLYVDILFANETEAAEFATANDINTKDLKEVALKVADMEKVNSKRSRMVVFTQGDLPAIVAKDGKITEYPASSVDSKNIVDTNGAGDAFVGGFLAQLVQGKPISECMRCGHWAGNLIIQQSGCTFPKKPSFV